MDLLKTPSRKKPSLIDRYFLRAHTLKTSDAFLYKGALLACVFFATLFLIQLSTENTEKIPSHGGIFTEGILGTPRFVNPVLAVTRADKDLTTLMFDGLMSLGADGALVPSVAETVTVSDDGLTYNVILKNSIKFHDGTPLTARDVIFTIGRMQDPLISSPLRANFDGVTVEQIGEFELNFILPEAYAPFTENLTFGILPEHIWKDAGAEEFPFSQLNSNPIGSGPYMIQEILRNSSGIPETYILAAYPDFHAGMPKIDTFELHFYPTQEKLQEALTKKVIQSVIGIDPSNLGGYALNETTHHLERMPLPRTFAVFFNQNKNTALRDPSARAALNEAINRTDLVATVLGGYGNALQTPVPPGFQADATTTTPAPSGNIDTAREILKSGGWDYNVDTKEWQKEIDGSLTTLTFSIATVNSSAFEATAQFLANAWEQLGVPVTIKQFEQTDLTQAIIRPRDYEALLFGTQLGRPLDFYSFWHSSQRNDPGLNIALYANITTDSILLEMRRSTDVATKAQSIQRFTEEVAKETPALFLYAPELLYIFPNTIHNTSFTGVGEPHERFMRVHEWYIETESVWPVFTD